MPSRPKVFRTGASAQVLARQYETRRGSARARGYSAAWDRAAAAFRSEHPLCLGCLAVGRTEPATLTDHIVPHGGDPVLFWDPSNWQGGCDWHHSVVKQHIEIEWRAGRLPAAALRLDSDAAAALTLTLRGVGG